ncbi:MAG: energy-coupling factor transporter transmembrane protein EcfT, partial [Deltaproteobacteria bacterium]|nr:energy-coupling factor transporter transmembrane protein EcfT [Deltaproteobacteria bacterium]
RLWRGFFIPLVFRALASADELSLALEMKGLKREALTWPRPPIFTRKDLTLILLGVFFFLATCAIRLQ